MLDLIASIAVRSLNLFFNLMPISIALAFGRALGGVIFFFNRKRRLIAYANLRAAFAKEKPPKEMKHILKRVYQNMAQTFVEVLNLTKVSSRFVARYINIVNLERIEKAASSGRGVILLTAHFGDWELSSLVGATKGFPMTVLAREQKMKRLNELLNRLRESKGCKVVRKGISTKLVFRALRNKEIVGILADQDAGKKGVFVDFFGRPTSTAAGAFEFAQRTGAILLPNFIARVRGPHHNLFLEEYIDVSSSDTKAAVQRYMSLLESYVRRYPEQWLWLHKRWKSTPIKKVLVLSDGRAGHLNQSLALAGEIRRARQTQGYRKEDTEIVVADVKFKNGLSKALLGACGNFSSWRCHGCMACLRFCLDESSYERLIKTYCDFVVSCGSALAPVNVLVSRENNAKNIVIMRPGGVSLGHFSLAIVPKHDRVLRRKNVVATDTAPNTMDEERMASDGEILKRRLTLTKGVRIGVLIGGDNSDYRLTDEIAAVVAGGISAAAEDLDAEILLTTSRRTPKSAEEILKKRFSNNPRCRLLVIANESNSGEVVGGILALSSVVAVSGESVSMVSEAVSSGKKVVVFNLRKAKDRGLTKYEASLRNLESGAYLKITEPLGLAGAIVSASRDTSPAKRPPDREAIFEATRRLI